MAHSTITFRLYPGVRVGSGRAVGLLEGHPDLGGSVLFVLPENERDYILASMDTWVNGLNGPKRRFHGFEGSPCFVFKHVTKQHRFYGYLWHPQPNTNKALQVCVITTYTKKKEWETDQADLKHVLTWLSSPAAKPAIVALFPDNPKGSSQ
jgi:hypothetical protein